MTVTINNATFEVLGKYSENLFIVYCYNTGEIEYEPALTEQIKEILELSLKEADPIQQIQLLNNTNFFVPRLEDIIVVSAIALRNYRILKYTQALLNQHPNNKILERFAKYYHIKYQIHKQH
jgi:hypothetical protein